MRYLDLLRLATGIVVLVVMSVTSCAETAQTESNPLSESDNRVPGEYILVLEQGDADEIVRRLYSDYTVQSIKDLGRRRFLIKLEHDPGPDIVTKKATESNDIKWAQPNYKYRYQ
ncbi:MAG: hypothetical protein GY807_24135 [Gammaproteobacteria bacterium]|nr:hypothetical protein [Gammaproteobacteria bacterium]